MEHEEAVALGISPDPLHDIRHLGNPDFIGYVQGMLDTHVRKAAGYSGSDNPDTWANFREAEAWGSTALEGCLVRMGDKYRRVQNLRRNATNDRVGESIKDTLLDLANYAIIAVCLMDEEARASEAEQDRQVQALNEKLALAGIFEQGQATFDAGALRKKAVEALDPAIGGDTEPDPGQSLAQLISTFVDKKLKEREEAELALLRSDLADTLRALYAESLPTRPVSTWAVDASYVMDEIKKKDEARRNG